MCYRCDLCRRVVPHGQSIIRHTIRRRNQIVREIPICGSCHGALIEGTALADLRREAPSQQSGYPPAARRRS